LAFANCAGTLMSYELANATWTFFTCLIKFTRAYRFIAYLNKEMGINKHSALTNFSECISNEISSGAPINYGVTLSSPCSSCSSRSFRTTLRLLLASDQPRVFCMPTSEGSLIVDFYGFTAGTNGRLMLAIADSCLNLISMQNSSSPSRRHHRCSTAFLNSCKKLLSSISEWTGIWNIQRWGWGEGGFQSIYLKAANLA